MEKKLEKDFLEKQVKNMMMTREIHDIEYSQSPDTFIDSGGNFDIQKFNSIFENNKNLQTNDSNRDIRNLSNDVQYSGINDGFIEIDTELSTINNTKENNKFETFDVSQELEKLQLQRQHDDIEFKKICGDSLVYGGTKNLLDDKDTISGQLGYIVGDFFKGTGFANIKKDKLNAYAKLLLLNEQQN